MMSFINHADRVKIACQAQLVNHLSLFNCVEGGPVWKQTIYYPFLYTSKYGRGTALRVEQDSPTYDGEKYKNVPALHTAAVVDKESRTLTVFVVNRDTLNDITAEISLQGFEKMRETEHIVYQCDDLEAVNSADMPQNVVPVSLAVSGEEIQDSYKAELGKCTWHMFRFAY